jgi:hypothetical protein
MPWQMELIYAFGVTGSLWMWGEQNTGPGGPMEQPYDADFWRQRAEEARALAQTMTLPVARREMEHIAASYQRLVDRAERTAGRSGTRGHP